MSGNVDNRVVAMKFDNASFEQKIAQTLKSLEALRKSLEFSGATKGMEHLAESGKRFSLESMGSSIDNIAQKFSAMNAIAFSVINNITTRAVDMGITLAKAITIDPIKDGLQEFELQMNSIQTILGNTKSKGTTLDEINQALEELNLYADKTIYNFGTMTTAIGRFTSAGIDLDTSVASIKGLANVSALAGANAEDTSRAMIQMAQAMSSGTVRLQDWMSMETANINSEAFQESLKETARLHGINVDAMIEKNGNFRLSLQEEWLTAEIMTETLQKFTGDLTDAQLASLGYTDEQIRNIQDLAQTANDSATKVKTFTQFLGTMKEALATGWADSFKKLFGDFNQTQTFFTGLADVFGGIIQKNGEVRNSMLQAWADNGGREAAIQSLRNVMWSLAQVIGTVTSAFREVFPKTTGEEWATITKAIESFTRKLILSGSTLENVKSIFKGVFSIFGIGWEIVKNIAGAFADLFGILGNIEGGGVLSFFAKMGDSLSNLRDSLVNGGGIDKFFATFITPAVEFIKSLDFSKQIDWIVENFNRLRSELEKIFGNIDLTKQIQTLTDGFNSFKESISKIFGIDISPATDALGDATGRLQDRFASFMEVGEKLGGFFDKVEEFVGKAAEAIGGLFEKIGESLQSGDFSAVEDALNVGLFGAIFYLVKRFLDGGVLGTLFGNNLVSEVTGFFDELKGVLTSLQTAIKADALLKIAFAVGVLTASLFVLSMIDSEKLGQGLLAIGYSLGSLGLTMVALAQLTSDPKMAAGLAAMAASLIIVAGAVLVLSAAVAKLGGMDAGELAKGTTTIAALMAALVGFVLGLKEVTKDNKMMGGKDLIILSLGILAISKALGKMADVVVQLGAMPFDAMLRGLLGLGVIFAGLVIALKAMPDDLGVKGFGMTLFAAALWVIAHTVEELGSIPFEQLVQGLVGVVGIMASMAIALSAMPPNLPAIALGLILVGVSLMVISGVIKDLGAMDFNQLVQGLIGMAAALVVIAIAANAMSGALLGAVAIGIIAVSLLALAETIKVLDAIGLGSVLIALVGLAAGLLVIGVAAAIFGAASPLILAGAAALFLLGVAAAAFGLGAILFGAGVALIALAVKTLVEVGVEGINLFIETLPGLVTALAEAITGFITKIVEAAPGIITGFGEIIGAIIDVIEQNIPKIGELLITIVDTIINVITTNLPKIQEAGYEILFKLLAGISENIERITLMVSEIIIKFLNALSLKMEDIVQAGLLLLTQFLNGVADNIDMVIQAVYNIITTVINELGNGASRIIEAGGNLIIKLLEGVGQKAQDVIDAGGQLLTDIIQGISDTIQDVIDKGAEIVIEFLNGVADSIDEHAPELREAGLNLLQAIVDGITGGMVTKAQEVIDGAKEMGSNILGGLKEALNINSPSKETIKIAASVAEGLVTGLRKDRSVETASQSLGDRMLAKVNTAIDRVSLAVASMDEFSPTIAPVLDLSNVEKGAKRLSALMTPPQLDTDVSFGQAAALAIATRDDENQDDTPPPVGDVKYEYNQTINAPDPLSATDVYRGTRTLLSFAEKED